MDDLPSRVKEWRRSERVARATPNKTCEAASASEPRSEPRGIYDLTTDFGRIYLEIARGVSSVRRANLDADEWDDVFQTTCVKGWDVDRRKPKFFARGSPLNWARRVAHRLVVDVKRSNSQRVIRDQALQQDALEGRFDSTELDRLIKEERQREMIKRFRLASRRSQLVAILIFIRGLSRSEAAAVLGWSEKAVKTALERARRELTVLFSDWKPRGSRTTNGDDHE